MSQRRQIWASPVLQNTLPASDGPNIDLDFLSPDSIDLLRALIDRNPNLATFSEYWSGLTPQQTTLFQNSLCNHYNHLSQIHLTRWEASVADIQLLIDNSPKLRNFSFSYGTLHESTLPPTMPRTVNDLPSVPPLPPVSDGKTLEHRIVLDLKHIEKASFSTSIFVGHTVPTIHIHAPELTSYTWSGFIGATRFSGTEPIATSFLACSTWHCPRLSSIRVMLENNHILVGMPRMLKTADKLVDIAFERCVMSDEFLAALVHRHRLSLRKVNLKETKGVSSTSIGLVLSSCPALFFFRGPHEALHALDWIKAPWVCHKLQFLTVFLDFSGLGPVYVPLPPLPEPENAPLSSSAYFSSLGPVFAPPQEPESDGPVFRNPYAIPNQERIMMSDAQAHEIYGVIYDQLAQLPELCSINFGGVSNGKTYVMGVPWSLKSGLAKLSPLKKLDEIYVTESVHAIGVEEAEWMKENWPRLKTVWRQDDTKSVVTEVAFAKVERAFRPIVRVAVDMSGSEFPF